MRNALVVTAMAALLWVAIGSNVIGMARERDFLNLYTGGLLARTGHLAELHNYELQAATQDRLMGRPLPLHMPFVRPAFYAVLLVPISLLPVNVAFPVWISLQIAGMVAAWAWAWRRFGPDAQVYCAFFLPVTMGIAHGQDCVVLLLIMLGAWTLMEKRRDGLAGLLLALSLFKFHLFLLVPLAILLRRRWKLMSGYAGGGALLALISLALGGIAGAREYLHLLTRKDLATLSPSPEMMVGLNSIAVNLGLDFLWFKAALVAAAVALVVWTGLRARDDRAWFWTAVTGSMLLSPHTYEYDLSSLMIPALMAVFGGANKIARMAAATALIPLFYFFTVGGPPWAIAPSLVIVAFFIGISGIVPVGARVADGAPAAPELAA